MSKELSYSFISYEEYKADKDKMSGADQMIHQTFQYHDNGLDEIQQMIASLKCIIPAECDLIAKDVGVTGQAHNACYKQSV